MKQIFLIIGLTIFINFLTLGQNLFPEKFDDCNIGRFCLDCGDIKGSYKGDLTKYFSDKIPLKKIKELDMIILVQVLIDSTGRQCVKSIQNNIPNLGLKDIINSMHDWQPAITKEKPENVSITLKIVIKESKIFVSYQRFDVSKFTNMKSVGSVEITNNKKQYKNTTVLNMEVFTTQNSKIPCDMTRSVSVDNDNIIWLGTDNGIAKIDNGKMTVFNSSNSALRLKWKKTTIMYSAVDIQNNKWFTDGYNTYKFDNKNWIVYDSLNTPLKWTTGIYADNYGNVWFQSFDGLVKYDGSNWSIMDTTNSLVPFNNISGVFVDSKNRLWIGTYKGNIMIENGKTTNFKDLETPLKNASISNVNEDKQGNLWFSLYESSRKYSGLAKLTSNGDWSIFNISNSEIPSNDILDFEIDNERNIFWLSINKVGIVRYDGKNWEVYTPGNSKFPSTYIQNISLDKEGNLWCATFAGLLKISEKK